jgi:hypothetical protein
MDWDSPIGTWAPFGLLYQPRVIHDNDWWNDWLRKPKYWEKTCPSATLFTTNPTRLYSSSNPGRRFGNSATNLLRYDKGNRARPVRKADNLTAIFEPIV